MNELGRIDFLITPLAVDEDGRQIKVRIEPNPDRYEVLEIKGQRGYLDLHTSTFIPEALMCSALEQMNSRLGDMPIHCLSPAVKSLPLYSKARSAAVAKQLATGIYEAPHERAKAHVELQEFADEKYVAFISVDICRSTMLRKLNPKSYDASLDIFVQELATLVGQYNGTILKFTGDGFIAYIDYPAFTIQADTAVALGEGLLYHLRNCVNPVLKDSHATELSMRVGIDFGLARAKRINVQAIGKSQIDFVSDALNFAVKIQESCEVDEVRIGQGLRNLLHEKYIRKLIEVDYDSRAMGEEGYKVYRLG